MNKVTSIEDNKGANVVELIDFGDGTYQLKIGFMCTWIVDVAGTVSDICGHISDRCLEEE